MIAAFLALYWPELTTITLALLIASACLYWFDRDLTACLIVGVPYLLRCWRSRLRRSDPEHPMAKRRTRARRKH